MSIDKFYQYASCNQEECAGVLQARACARVHVNVHINNAINIATLLLYYMPIFMLHNTLILYSV